VNVVKKEVAILIVISVLISSVLAIQVVRDGGLALGQLVSPTMQSASSIPLGKEGSNNGAANTNTTILTASGGNASAILDTESAALNQVFKKAGGSVVQITSKVKTTIPNIIINGNPYESQSTRLGSSMMLRAES
jgi:hypothetical protein